MQKAVIRFSDQDLNEFKMLIESKIAKTHSQLAGLEEQLNDLYENGDNSFDPDDNGNSLVNREFLQEMVHRQRKHLRDLENALVRVLHKTYGICEVTGALIDKKRLIAVPTTTKSLAAKLANHPRLKPARTFNASKRSSTKVILEKMVQKPAIETITGLNSMEEDLVMEADLLEEEAIEGEWKLVPFDEEMEGLV